MRDGLPVPGLCESLTTASPMAFFDGEVPLEWERAEKLAASQQEHMIESEYLRVLLRMLRLDASEYPWGRATDAFSRPVYQNVGAKNILLGQQGADDAAHQTAHSSAPHAGPSGGWLPFSEDERGTQALACLRQCAPLLRSTGMRPPWCKAVDAFQAEHCERT